MQIIEEATERRASRKKNRKKIGWLTSCLTVARWIGTLLTIVDKVIDLYTKLRGLFH